MGPGVMMGRVYMAIKVRVMAGEFAPKSRIDPGQLPLTRIPISPMPVSHVLPSVAQTRRHRLGG